MFNRVKQCGLPLLLTLPVLAQSQLIVVFKDGQRQVYDMKDISLIAFSGDPGGLTGTWEWTGDRTLLILPGGSFALFDRGGRKTGEGTWVVVDPKERRFRLTHATGETDTVTLRRDGEVISGTDSRGARLYGKRKKEEAVAPQTAAASLQGRWVLNAGRSLLVRGDQTFDVFEGERKTNTGRWEPMDATGRRYMLVLALGGGVWKLTLSEDGQALEGVDDRAAAVKGNRP